MDGEMIQLLEAWELGKYIEIFERQLITVGVLTLLSDNEIKELIPPIGDRVKLRANIEEYKRVVEQSLSSPLKNNTSPTNVGIIRTPASITNPSANDNNVAPTNIDMISTPASITNPSANDSLLLNIDLFNLSDKIESDSIETCELLSFLKSITAGQAILFQYEKNDMLDQTARNKLCNLIIHRELAENVSHHVSPARLHNLAQQIKHIFPKENVSTYFAPYLSIDKLVRRSAKGKLFDCLNNRKRDYRKTGFLKREILPSTSSDFSSRTQLLDAEIEFNDKSVIQDSILWLKNSVQPWDLVESHWSITTKERLQELSSTGGSLYEYMNTYPALKKPSGYTLLVKDFNNIYAGYAEKIYERFPLFKDKILKSAESKFKQMRDPTLKKIFEEYNKELTSGEFTQKL